MFFIHLDHGYTSEPTGQLAHFALKPVTMIAVNHVADGSNQTRLIVADKADDHAALHADICPFPTTVLKHAELTFLRIQSNSDLPPLPRIFAGPFYKYWWQMKVVHAAEFYFES